MELVHYAQPLLNEADSWQSDAFRHPAETTSLAGPDKCWKAISLSRAYAGEASQHLDAALARLRNEMDDPALHIAPMRYQYSSICDVVSNTLTAEPSRFTTAVDKIVLEPFPRSADFLFVTYLILRWLSTSAGRYSRCLTSAPWRCCAWYSMDWLHAPLPGLVTIFLAQGLGAALTPCCHWCRRLA